MLQANTEERAVYAVRPVESDEDEIIRQAKEILARRLHREPVYFDAPQIVRDWLIVNFAGLDHEEFGCVFLDCRNCVLAAESLFRGTLTQTSVYPREVVKAALAKNASAVVFFHNHPSGVGEPSTADELLTKTLANALALVDVRTLDHFIVAGTAKPMSFAERGLL